jgi:DNA-binding transcriptional ArsR family regulator
LIGDVLMKQNAEFLKVKTFLEDVLTLHGVSKSIALLLFEMTPYLNLQDQIIVNSFLKKELATKTRMSKGTIDNTLTKLNEVGLLVRLDRGTYVFHPVLYEVRKLLQNDTAKMKITYTPQTRSIETE